MVEEAVLEAKMRRLWLHVILQATVTARGQRIKGVNLSPELGVGEVRRAVKWLTSCSRSFKTVCSLSGMSGEETKFLIERNRREFKNVNG